MKRKLILSVALLLSALPGPLLAGADVTARLQETLVRFLEEDTRAPGVVACILGPGLGLDWTGSAGLDRRGGDRPLTAAHTFRIASNTKTYVAAAMFRLEEQGLLDLDDPLARHLPPAQKALLEADGYDLSAMTLRQVLGHTSGLFEHPADPRYAAAILADPQHVWTPAEQIEKCVAWGDPVGPPGGQFSYSDTGYVILGGIIERTTGRALGPAVRQLLDFARLGLAATWWEIMEEAPAGAGPRAHQYYGEHDTFTWHPSLDLFGGGGLLTDVDDLARFTRSLLRGEVLRHESSLAAMTGDGTATYRLGLSCTELHGRLAFGHTGFWNTFAFHVPSLDLTVAGCVLDHEGTKGQELADRLLAVIEETID
jgi:D-alanyl-D-alanine carboxypeptidase